VCPGALYGGGEFEHGFLASMRAAWEGKPVCVYGDGDNVIPCCHVKNLATFCTKLAAKASAVEEDGTSIVVAGEEEKDNERDIDRYLLLTDEAPHPTQRFIAESIARAFDAPLVRVPVAAAAATASSRVVGDAPSSGGGAEGVAMLNVNVVPSDVTRVVGAGGREWRAHVGGFGPAVEPEAPEEEAEVAEEKDSDAAEDGTSTVAAADDAAEGEDAAAAAAATPEDPKEEKEEDKWELVPELVGGMPAVAEEFLQGNGLAPIRAVVRGPPLSFAEDLALTTAETYALPLITPASLLLEHMPSLDEETRAKCGEEALKEALAAAAAAAAAEGAAAAAADADADAADAEAAAAPPPAEATGDASDEPTFDRDDVAATHFEALASEVKTELLKAALETKTIKRLGYVMTAACVATPEECHEVFTHIPPRPARRRKKKPAPQGPAEEGEDGDGDAAAAEGGAAAAEDGGAAAEDGGDAAPAELAPEEEEEEPEPEETPEEAEARRVLNPSTAPTVAVTLEITDEGQRARTFKLTHPELYEKYVEWAKEEEAAHVAWEELKTAARDARAAAKEAKSALKAATEETKEAAATAAAEANAAAVAAEAAAAAAPCTDVVTRWLTIDPHRVRRSTIDARGSAHTRIKNVRRALGRPNNFEGVPEEPAEDPEAAAAAARERRREEALLATREARRARSDALAARQRAASLAREEDALHQRSASLRQFLGEEVMPTVTGALLSMLKLRPPDPVLALSEYLLRKDREAEFGEEAERQSAKAIERAVYEEAKAAEAAAKLEISRKKAEEARRAIKPRSVVRVVPKLPPKTLRPPPSPSEVPEGGGGEGGGEGDENSGEPVAAQPEPVAA